MTTTAQVNQLKKYQRLMAVARKRLIAVSERAWSSQSSYHRESVEEFLELMLPQILAGRIAIAELTDAYIAATAGKPSKGLIKGIDQTRRIGVTDTEVYERPFREVWMGLAAGQPLDEAVEAGKKRLVGIVQTDLQLAKRDQQQASLRSTGFTYYTRVLTGAEDCAACVIASTQRYRTENLEPMHPGCDCDIAPVTADSDPGQVINQTLLDDLRTAIYDQGGDEIGFADADERDIAVTPHPELGLVLGLRAKAS